MPRRNRREPSGSSDEEGVLTLASISERVLGPGSARLEGFETRSVVNKLKRYRCPYCSGWVEPGTQHIVAVPSGSPEGRRHYHTGCWAKQLRQSSSAVRAARS